MRGRSAHAADRIRWKGDVSGLRIRSMGANIRPYYSQRTGQSPRELDLANLARLFDGIWDDFKEKDYFQEWFGYECVDGGDVPGRAGRNIDRFVFSRLRKDIWGVAATDYTEDDLFDMIEFLHDHVSKPSGGDYHSYCDCGMHYGLGNATFDAEAGRAEYRAEIDAVLRDYGTGYELSAQGEVLALAEPGMEGLLANRLPSHDEENVEARVANAIGRFRRSRSSLAEKKAAVRELSDVLEFLRPRLKEVLLSKDEADLFNIANNFGIRHHNAEQKTDYDEDFWVPWMFYHYLSTIHVALRLIRRSEQAANKD